MNLNAMITAPAECLTMSSREIAELCDKRHDNVIRDIKTMLDGLGGDALSFEGYYTAANGKQNPEYNLPKRESLILVSGYKVELRARIIDRWMELEAAVAAPAVLDQQLLNAIGMMVQAAVSAQIQLLIPSLVKAEIASNSTVMRPGQTAGQIWSRFNLPRLKNASIWLGNRLAEMGCLIEGQGRVEIGGKAIRLFDPDKAAICMKNGLANAAKMYAQERAGQQKLRLVQTDKS